MYHNMIVLDARDLRSVYKHRVSNKRRPLIDAGGSEAHVLINAGGVY